MIKKLIAMRVEKLLNEIDLIASAHSERLVDSEHELSPIKKASMLAIPPKEMKRLLSIREQIILLNAIFGSNE